MSCLRLLVVLCCLLPWSAMAARQHPPSRLSSAVQEARININTATADELDEALTGIGPSKARAIVAWRRQHGAFRDIAQLEEVKGLGPSFTARNRNRLRLQ